MELYIITFMHGSYAIAAYNKLQGYGLKNIKVAQTPFSIKGECDMCIKTHDRKTLDIVLNECRKRYPVSNVYMEAKQDGRTVYKLLP